MAPGNARCSPPRDRGTSIQDIDNLAAVDPTINIETQRPAQGKSGGRASRQKKNVTGLSARSSSCCRNTASAPSEFHCLDRRAVPIQAT
jgi:hypothetical protein